MIARWTAAEEEGFGRTLAQGERLLGDLVARAREGRRGEVRAEDAFRLARHLRLPVRDDKELLERGGLTVDEGASPP